MFEIVAGELRARLMRQWRGPAGLRGAAPNEVRPPISTPGPTGVKGAGGTGGHGRASRSTTPSEARVWRSRGRPGPPAPGTPVGPQATPSIGPAAARGADGERAGRPRGGRRSVGGGSDNCRIYSPARRSTSCMMRPHTALTQATAATPRTRERQGRICRKSSKP